MAARLLLIRHAETGPASLGLLVGSTDIAPEEAALQRLERFREVLSAFAPQKIYSSPLQRAVQSAGRIVAACGLDCGILVDGRLREIDFGRWEMQSVAGISRDDPLLLGEWAKYDNFVFPGGEAVAGFCARVADVYAAFSSLPSGDVVVVTHGGVIRTMICLALGQDPRNYLLYKVLPGTMTVIDLHSEGGVLAGMNL
jgi:broad specificity phosphatase PhoE